jgi:hypothetical protein
MDKQVVIEVIIIFLMIAYPFIFKFIDQYLSKKGEGQAIKEDSREIEYEKTKGQNLATKEDFEELTRQLESVKNEISFESQRKHDFINQRTERLVNILYIAEKLDGYNLLLFSCLYNKYAANRLIELIEEINETLLTLTHEVRMSWITVENDDLRKRTTSLIKTANDYSSFLCQVASNAATHLNNWNDYLKLAEKNDNSQKMLLAAIDSQNKLEALRQEFERYYKSNREPFYDSQIKYLSKLNFMFGSEFHLKA